MTKTRVIGRKPKTFTLTQVSVEKLRHTSSFTPAIAKRKTIQRQVSVRQPASESSSATVRPRDSKATTGNRCSPESPRPAAA